MITASVMKGLKVTSSIILSWMHLPSSLYYMIKFAVKIPFLFFYLYKSTLCYNVGGYIEWEYEKCILRLNSSIYFHFYYNFQVPQHFDTFLICFWLTPTAIWDVYSFHLKIALIFLIKSQSNTLKTKFFTAQRKKTWYWYEISIFSKIYMAMPKNRG